MPKVQNKNDAEIKYIYCLKRRNQPMMNTLVCEQCGGNKKCAPFQAFKKGITIDEYNASKKKRRRRKKRI